MIRSLIVCSLFFTNFSFATNQIFEDEHDLVKSIRRQDNNLGVDIVTSSNITNNFFPVNIKINELKYRQPTLSSNDILFNKNFNFSPKWTSTELGWKFKESEYKQPELSSNNISVKWVLTELGWRKISY